MMCNHRVSKWVTRRSIHQSPTLGRASAPIPPHPDTFDRSMRRSLLMLMPLTRLAPSMIRRSISRGAVQRPRSNHVRIHECVKGPSIKLNQRERGSEAPSLPQKRRHAPPTDANDAPPLACCWGVPTQSIRRSIGIRRPRSRFRAVLGLSYAIAEEEELRERAF